MLLITLKQPQCWKCIDSTFYIKLQWRRSKAQEASLSVPVWRQWFSGPLSDSVGCELPLTLSDVSVERISGVLMFPICSAALSSLCSSFCASCQPWFGFFFPLPQITFNKWDYKPHRTLTPSKHYLPVFNIPGIILHALPPHVCRLFI